MSEDLYTFNEEFNLSVQKKFISLLLYDQTWAKLNGFDIVKPEYFENRTLHNVCKWIHEFYNQYKTLPTKLHLSEKAKDFMNLRGLSTNEFYQYTELLDEIFTIDDNDNFEYFKEKAVVFVRQVAWKKACLNATKALNVNNYEDSLNAAIEEFKKVLAIGAENDLGIDFDSVNLGFLDLLKEDYDKSSMVPTGIPGWDEALGGGFVKKNLHLIGGAPGFGKSRTMAYLTKVALQAYKKVIFITLELSEVETMTNIITSMTGIGMHEMLVPENAKMYEEKLMQFKDVFKPNLVVKFYKPSAVTADTIHNFIQKVIRHKEETTGKEWKPDYILIDYLDKLLPVQKVKGNTYEDIGGVCDDCKNLAITFNCPVISGSQLGRFSWDLKGDEVISMSSIAESARKIHLCHSLTTLNANPAEKELGKVRLYMAKSRSGIPGRQIFVDNNLGKCNMTECIEPWDAKDVFASTAGVATNIKTNSK